MRYVIDGYNLLFALGRLGPRSGKGALEGARRWLLQQLRQAYPPGSDVTVVFDASSTPRGVPRLECAGDVRVEFSHGDSADDVIEDIIHTESAPRLLTVVSNDHRLQQAARRRGCVVLACLDYFEKLTRVPRTGSPQPEDPVKPQTTSPEDAEHWLREFGDGGDDPLLRDPF